MSVGLVACIYEHVEAERIHKCGILGTPSWWGSLRGVLPGGVLYTHTHTQTHSHKYTVVQSPLTSCGMEPLAERSPIKNLIRVSEISGSRRWALEACSRETQGGAGSWMSALEPTTLLNPQEKVVQGHWQEISKVVLFQIGIEYPIRRCPLVSVRLD